MDQFVFLLISGKKKRRKKAILKQTRKPSEFISCRGKETWSYEKGLGGYLRASLISSFPDISPISSGQYQTSVHLSFQEPIPSSPGLLFSSQTQKELRTKGRPMRKTCQCLQGCKGTLSPFGCCSSPTVCYSLQQTFHPAGWCRSTAPPWAGPALSPLSASCLVQQMSLPRRKIIMNKMDVML